MYVVSLCDPKKVVCSYLKVFLRPVKGTLSVVLINRS